MYFHVKKSECMFVCMSPSVDSSVCVCVFVFTAISRISSYEGCRAAQQRGKRLGKTNELCLLSSCYLINVFNKERKTARCPNLSHILHVHLPLSPCSWTLSHPPYLLINPSLRDSSVRSPFKASYPTNSICFLKHSGKPKEKLQVSLLIRVPDEQVFCTTVMSRSFSLCHFQHSEASFFFQDRRVYDPARTDEDAVWEECKSAKFKTVCCSVPKSHFTFWKQ